MRLFIVTGISGSGKTTVARELNARGYLALDSKINPGLFYFVDTHGNIPPFKSPNDPQWLSQHKWVLDRDFFNELVATTAADEPVFLCGGGDSLKPLWKQTEKVFLLKVDASTMIARLKSPARDNQFGQTESAQSVLLNRLEKYQSNQLAAGAIPIDALAPIKEVVDSILGQTLRTQHSPSSHQPLPGAYLIFGGNGSGKSTIGRAIKARGYRVIENDFEPGLSGWTNLATGLRVPHPPAHPSHEWLTAHKWCWDETIILRLLREAQTEPLFIDGGAHNFDKFLAKFRKRFRVRVNNDVMKARLQVREPERWTEDSADLARVLAWNARPNEFDTIDAIQLDGSLPAEQNAGIILMESSI